MGMLNNLEIWKLKFVALAVSAVILLGMLQTNAGAFSIFIFTLGLAVYILPTLALYVIVLPLGLTRVAYWVVRSCRPLDFAYNTSMGGIYYGALAMARHGCTPKTLGWLRQQVATLPVEDLNGTGLVITGLLAALEGNKQQACYLFRIADNRPGPWCPRRMRIVARNWLMAAAIQSCNWFEAIRLGKRGRDSSPWSYCAACIAERIVGKRTSEKDWLLWAFWLIVPDRRNLLPTLRFATARPLAATRARSNYEESASSTDTLPLALFKLVSLLRHPRGLMNPAFAQAVKNVCFQLDRSDTNLDIRQRLNTLGAAPEYKIIVQRFRQQLLEFIKPFIEIYPHLARGASDVPIIMQAAGQIREKLFGDIEICCADYVRRTDKKQIMDNLAERISWETLKNSAENLLTIDPSAENLMSNVMVGPLCNFAASLDISVNRLELAYEIFSWLHSHSLGDQQVTALLANNMVACKGVHSK
jgi:hypothetical protein